MAEDRPLSLIQTLQKHLLEIYALPPGSDITEFLIDETTLLRYTQERHLHPEVQEKILFQCNEDQSVHVGLYIRERILQNLQNHQPEEDLNHENLADFCSVVEGVSHFTFFEFRSATVLPLSVLELELQAEVDKFITSFIYQVQQDKVGPCAESLHRRLFHDFRLRENLSEPEKERYHLATRAAAQLCKKIQRKFLQKTRSPDWSGLLAFLRKFYRKSGHEKLSMIAATSMS